MITDEDDGLCEKDRRKKPLVTDVGGDEFGLHRPGYRFLVGAPMTDAREQAYRDYWIMRLTRGRAIQLRLGWPPIRPPNIAQCPRYPGGHSTA